MGRGQKRQYRRDFGRGNKGNNSWEQDRSKDESGSGGHGGKRPRTGGVPDTSKWIMNRDEMRNVDFEEYYTAQRIVPEGEWEPFMSCLRVSLPVTFRINGCGKYADSLRDRLMTEYSAQETIEVDGEVLEPPCPLPWYPPLGNGWKVRVSRGKLRKSHVLEEMHERVKRANEVGVISRQEAVSMVPPLFMGVRPGHRVLDMCAAPGSKTLQLLEALHHGTPDGVAPRGFVVANDADFRRCNLLTHQTKRVCSPCLVVTNHRAEQFPVIKKDGRALKFDRVLCDVPCSGDGTLRKAPDIWRRWDVSGGNALHPLQVKIALKGCRVLAVGGRIVYSTCSFNPVENEAVVAEILRRTKGAIRVVDTRRRLPALKRQPGLTQWRVKDAQRWYESWDEARFGYKLCESMFPNDVSSLPAPVPDRDAVAEGEALRDEAELAPVSNPLELCMRFLPHHQDTGGFFVVVLEKVAEFTLGPEDEENDDEDGNNNDEGKANGGKTDENGKKGKGGRGNNKDNDKKEKQQQEEEKEKEKEEKEKDNVKSSTNAAAPSITRVSEADALAAAKAAAERALESAQEALDALDAEDPSAAEKASNAAAYNLRTAIRAQESRRATVAAEAVERVEREIAEKEAAEKKKEEADDKKKKEEADDKKKEETNEVVDVDVKAEKEASAGVTVVDASIPEASAASPAVPGEEAGEATAAAEGDSYAEKKRKLSDREKLIELRGWVRGGGARNARDSNGRGGRNAFSMIDPILPVNDAEVIQALVNYYGIDASAESGFPLRTQLITRSLESRPKRLYYVSEDVLDLLLTDRDEQLKITATGLKIFERQELREQINECPYRLAQEGLPFVQPHVTKQRAAMPVEVIAQLLKERALALPNKAEATAVDAEGTAAAEEVMPAVEEEEEKEEKEEEEVTKKEEEAEKEELKKDGDDEVMGEVTKVEEEKKEEEDAKEDAKEEDAKEEEEKKPEPSTKLSSKPKITNPEVVARLEALNLGCFIAELDSRDAARLGLASAGAAEKAAAGASSSSSSDGLAANAPLTLVAWKGKSTIAIMVEKCEASHMLEKLEMDAKVKAGEEAEAAAAHAE